MTDELTLLAWTVILGLLQLGLAAGAKRLQEPPGWAGGPRDTGQPVYTGVAARLSRAQNNLMETLPFFVAAILICHAAGRDGPLSLWGARLFFWGRVAYVPLYGLGVPYVRTLAWLIAVLGVCLVLTACLWPV